MSDRKKQEKQITTYRAYDYSLLVLIIVMVCFGLVMVYSTSSYDALKQNGDAMFYFKKQATFAGVGILFMIIISKINYHFYIARVPVVKLRLVTLLYFVCLALQIAVLAGFGKTAGGATRWIELPLIGRFQPSEITKVCVLMITALAVSLAPKQINKLPKFLLEALRVAPLIALVLVENLSTGLIMCAIFAVICFVASKKKWHFAMFGGLFVLGIAAFIVFGEQFRMDRIDAWLNVETHEDGQQTLQGLYAIASGGLWGKGLGNSVQKLGFIPEAHNDMIFSVICEELGLVGAIAIILLYLLILWRLFIIATNAPDLFGSLLTVGVMTQIAVQVILNVAVVTNTIPTTGISLPFVSYGGTALMVLLAEMGIVLNVSGRIEYKE